MGKRIGNLNFGIWLTFCEDGLRYVGVLEKGTLKVPNGIKLGIWERIKLIIWTFNWASLMLSKIEEPKDFGNSNNKF